MKTAANAGAIQREGLGLVRIRGMPATAHILRFVGIKEIADMFFTLQHSWARSIGLSTALGLLCFVSARSLSRQRPVHAQTVSQVVPLQATSIETMFSEAGTLSMRKSKRYVRFADHSIVMESAEVEPRSVPLLTSILNVRANTWIDLDAITRSSTTFSYQLPGYVKSFVEGLAGESCSDVDLSKASPSDAMFGYQTYYVKDNPDPSWTRERWLAPDLNCFPMKRIDSLVGGSRDEEAVTEITVADPPLSKLSIPFGYAERDPDTVETLHKEATHGEVFWGGQILYKRRKEYAAGRK